MTLQSLILRNLRHYARSYLAVLAGATLAAAVIAGALFVGDSVRQTLRHRLLARLGPYQAAYVQQGVLFRDDLGARITAEALHPSTIVTVLSARGSLATTAPRQANGVSIYGVTSDFGIGELGESGVVLNAETARRLDAVVGDELIVRIPKPSLLPRDSVLGSPDDATASTRLTVRAILPAGGVADFSLRAEQAPPANAFVALPVLQALLGQEGRANLLLAYRADAGEAGASQTYGSLEFGVIWERSLADFGLRIEPVPGQPELSDLRSDTGFLAADVEVGGADNIFTYFVNGLTVGERTTPYSMVCGRSVMPGEVELADDEIAITDWLADDLQATVGDMLTMRYWVEGVGGGLVERQAVLTVRAVLPLAAVGDPSLMPDWPGMSDAEHCRDWDTGAPVDMTAIRLKDEQYWTDHRGSPKAFVTLATAQRLWSSRYGGLSMVRIPDEHVENLIDSPSMLAPPTVSGEVVNLPKVMNMAVAQGTDFGGLFAALSVFLIVAALVLQLLLLRLLAERRSVEWGTMAALGFDARSLRRLARREMALVVTAGALLGTALGVAYTAAVLRALNARWADAVGGTVLDLYVTPGTAGMALGITLVVGWASGAWALRRAGMLPPLVLLAGGAETVVRRGNSRGRGVVGAVCLLAGGVAAVVLEPTAGSYFTASILLLVGLICLLPVLAIRGTSVQGRMGGLVRANLRRSRGRNTALILIVAVGVWLTIAIGANHHDPYATAGERSSGTGGFDFFVVTTTPILERLDTAAGREALGLDAAVLGETIIVPGVLREGDDASCLNLNRAADPQLLGLDRARLDALGAFPLTASEERHHGPWVYGDANMLQYNLGLAVGDPVRAGGRPFTVGGAIGTSILQGYLVMDTAMLRDTFPQLEGYRVLLVDAPDGQEEAVREELAWALADHGAEITPAAARLARFLVVENTYLAIFQFLGGLALLLGMAGMAIVVSRNVAERRREFAMMRALGFRRRDLTGLVIREHAILLALGVVAGGLAAGLPLLRLSPTAAQGWQAAGLCAAVLGLGLCWTVLAARLSLRGDVDAALRDE